MRKPRVRQYDPELSKFKKSASPRTDDENVELTGGPRRSRFALRRGFAKLFQLGSGSHVASAEQSADLLMADYQSQLLKGGKGGKGEGGAAPNG